MLVGAQHTEKPLAVRRFRLLQSRRAVRSRVARAASLRVARSRRTMLELFASPRDLASVSFDPVGIARTTA